MKYEINFTPKAEGDLGYFKAYEQRNIVAAISSFLTTDAHIETKKRKRLEPNQISPWELKQDKYRIFFDIIDTTVDILAIGYKDHNDLYIQGRKVSL
jgi:mRNA-degrading endonuclease RelE of RelBE toxin-antitoxin system